MVKYFVANRYMETVSNHSSKLDIVAGFAELQSQETDRVNAQSLYVCEQTGEDKGDFKIIEIWHDGVRYARMPEFNTYSMADAAMTAWDKSAAKQREPTPDLMPKTVAEVAAQEVLDTFKEPLFDEQKAQDFAEGWLDWDGDGIPYTENHLVEYRLRDGYWNKAFVDDLAWSHGGGGADIVQYRIVQEAVPQQEDNGGWVEWNGGAQPVSDTTRVEVEWRGGGGNELSAFAVCWSHYGGGADVVRYRVVSDVVLEDRSEPIEDKVARRKKRRPHD